MGYYWSLETCTLNSLNCGKIWCFHNPVFLCPDTFSWISYSVLIASELAQKDKCLSRQQTWKPNNGLLFFLAFPIFLSAFHPNPLQFIVGKDDTDSLLKHCFCQTCSFPFSSLLEIFVFKDWNYSWDRHSVKSSNVDRMVM